MMSCPVNINAQCLGELSIKNTDGSTIGSKSACFALTNHSSVAAVLMAPQTLASPRTILSFLRLDANYLITFCP
ncbi:hypothetical protein ACSBR2_002817 [Camellia fascicularis]